MWGPGLMAGKPIKRLVHCSERGKRKEAQTRVVRSEECPEIFKR